MTATRRPRRPGDGGPRSCESKSGAARKTCRAQLGGSRANVKSEKHERRQKHRQSKLFHGGYGRTYIKGLRWERGEISREKETTLNTERQKLYPDKRNKTATITQNAPQRNAAGPRAEKGPHAERLRRSSMPQKGS